MNKYFQQFHLPAEGTRELEWRTVPLQTILTLQKQNLIDRDVAFQRGSVWSLANRENFIRQLFLMPGSMAFPRPFYFWLHDGLLSVIDGKQRLETLFLYTGSGDIAKNFEFTNHRHFPVTEGAGKLRKTTAWKAIQDTPEGARFLSLKMHVAVCTGSLDDARYIFRTENSVGCKLNASELQNSELFANVIYIRAKQLATEFREYFAAHKILTHHNIARLKHINLVTELFASMYRNLDASQNKYLGSTREASDVLLQERAPLEHLDRFANEIWRIFRLLEIKVPIGSADFDIQNTIFRNQTQFVSLVLALWQASKTTDIVPVMPKIVKALVQFSEEYRNYVQLVTKSNKDRGAAERVAFMQSSAAAQWYTAVFNSSTGARAREWRGDLLEQLITPYLKRPTKAEKLAA